MPWRVPLALLAVLAATTTLASAEELDYGPYSGKTPGVVGVMVARHVPEPPHHVAAGPSRLLSVEDRESSADAPAAGKAAPGILPDEEPTDAYVVAPGDCPSTIAARFGVAVDDLARANPGLDPKTLAVGRKLVIPTTNAAAPPPVPVSRPGAPAPSAPLVMDFR